MGYRFKFAVNIKSIEHVKEVVRGYKDRNGETVLETEDRGWFLCLEGSHEKIFVGMSKPIVEVGDKATVTIEV